MALLTVSKPKPECSRVEQDELAAGAFEDMADAGRGELDDEMAELGLAPPAELSQALSHRSSPSRAWRLCHWALDRSASGRLVLDRVVFELG